MLLVYLYCLGARCRKWMLFRPPFYFPGARDRLQNNHKHEFSDTLINQLFQEQQPSNFQRNTIPPLAIIFAINWSVGYWWRRSGY